MKPIRFANAPCSWGSLEFAGMEDQDIGYQQMLDELVETGYTGTELGDWGYMPTDPAQLAAELASRNLTLLGAFVPVALREPDAHEDGLQRAAQVALLMAEVADRNRQDTQPLLILADDNGRDPVRTRYAGRITPDLAMPDKDWLPFTRGCERITQTIRRDAGLKTAFHHHCAGFIETPAEIDLLLQRTDPDLLGLVFDTGHWRYGAGPQPSQTLRQSLERWAPRIWHFHLKDCHPEIAARARQDGLDYFEAVAQGLFCELGQGEIDFADALDWLAQHPHHQGWAVVEQDVLPGMGSPKQSARRNHDFLKQLTTQNRT